MIQAINVINLADLRSFVQQVKQPTVLFMQFMQVGMPFLTILSTSLILQLKSLTYLSPLCTGSYLSHRSIDKDE